jgi:2-dehydro-3-deoxyphosphooctonate aldolase (KDO 8-P synthase)
MSVSFQISDVRIGAGKLFLIAGPCVIESEAHAIRMAEIIKGVTRSLNIPFIFKASYDKANRTSIRSYRGPGLKEGLRILKKVKNEVHLPILTDVHEVADVAKVAEVADILQIPAFLCRQTDLVVAAAMSERVVNIKKGQFISPWDMRHVVEKCRTAGNDRVFVTERGSSFGYNNLVVDMRSLAIMRKFVPVVFDATHSVQLPSASQGDQKQGDEKQGDEKKDQPASSGGQPEFIPVLARAAVAAGVDGVFMEVHDKPQEAKSDGANALDSHKLRGVLKELLAVHQAVASGEIAVRRVRRTLG